MFELILIGIAVYVIVNIARITYNDPWLLVIPAFLAFAWAFPVPASFIFVAGMLVATVLGFRETWRGSAY